MTPNPAPKTDLRKWRPYAWSKVGKFEDVGEARKIFLIAAQRKRLLEHCSGGSRDLIEAGMLTGARYGELRTVLVSDYDKAARVLSIRKGRPGRALFPFRMPACSFSTG